MYGSVFMVLRYQEEYFRRDSKVLSIEEKIIILLFYN
jgi:hypothetical protein